MAPPNNLALAFSSMNTQDIGSIGGSRASSHRSRRLSAASQISHNSKRSQRSGKAGHFGGRPGRLMKVAESGDPEAIQVINEHGKDVTPKPLISLRPSIFYERLLQAPCDRFTPESDRLSAVLSRSGQSFNGSIGSFTPEVTDDEETERESGDTSLGKRSVSHFATRDQGIRFTDDKRRVCIVTQHASPPSNEGLEAIVPVTLVESENVVVISVRGYSVSNTYGDIKQVLHQNARYKKLLQTKVGSDNYSDSSAQTLMSLRKCKEAQISAVHMESEACQANSWDILDCYADKGRPKLVEDGNFNIASRLSTHIDDPDNRRIADMLVSAGYLEDSASLGTGLLNNLAHRMTGRGKAGPPRSSVTSNTPSRRGSLSESVTGYRRGSVKGSMVPSVRGSTSGSVVGSVRESTSGSLAPSSKGSVWGSSTSRRVSKIDEEDSSLSARGIGLDKLQVLREAGDGVLFPDLALSTSTKAQKVDVNLLPGLLKSLEIAERALAQNTYQDKLLFYRDFRPREPGTLEASQQEIDDVSLGQLLDVGSPNASSDRKPSDHIYWLWDFSCNLTEGRNISCMVWNKVSKDLLTVGYGQFEFGAQKDGLIAFWSLKNPCFPHATIATASGVTALDYSSTAANNLAVGFYDGNVAIYDVKNPKNLEPIVQSGISMGKHNDPVWKLQWIDSTSEHGQCLVSISTDGRVSQWSLKKELEYVNLLTLKRVPGHSKNAQPQPFISRRAAGLCFDFCPKDPSIYLVGTEEGHIHKCSRSYQEQYLQTYVGHTGPVFQVRWCPFLPQLFLSCSADWTIRLWREDQDTTLLVFQSATESIGDVRWSSFNSCKFGTTSEGGRLEIWDLSVSAAKPIAVFLEKRELSCMLFSDESPIIVSAGNNGAVSVFRLVCSEAVYDEATQAQRLKKALEANINTVLD